MARRLNLQAYQENILARLKEVGQAQEGASFLGVQIGEDAWLFSLNNISEVLPVPEIHPVPLTHAWFLGMTNVRGNLYAVTDLSSFSGGRPARMSGDSRLLLVSHRFGINAALAVDRLFGLKNMGEMQVKPGVASVAPWHIATYQDAGGREWRELDIAALLETSGFMQVAA